jgi:hypothetical protein
MAIASSLTTERSARRQSESRAWLRLATGLIVVTLIVGGCGSRSIAGTYTCSPPEGSRRDVVQFRDDGTFTITEPVPGEGTWSVEGDRGVFHSPEGIDDPFTVEGDRLVFDNGFVCTKTS